MKFTEFIKSKYFIIQMILFLVVFTLMMTLLTRFLKVYTNQDQKIQVPDLKGLSIQEVEVVLDGIKLKYEIVDSGTFNPNYPKGAVVNQQPAVGEIVKEKRKIYLTINPVSLSKVKIPSFYGKTRKEIIAILKNSGFKLEGFEQVNDIGTVVRGLKHYQRSLSTGQTLPYGSLITVIIGNGLGPNGGLEETDTIVSTEIINEASTLLNE